MNHRGADAAGCLPFMAWRDRLALRSRRQADYAWSVLARVLSWALDRGLILANPCEKGGRLYRATRTDKVWSDADEAAFLASAPPHLHLPLILASGPASDKATSCGFPGAPTTATRSACSRERPELGL